MTEFATSIQPGPVKLNRTYDGIKILTTKNKSSSTILEFRNLSDQWIAFKMKCTHPINFTVKPNACGLLAANENHRVRLNLLRGYDSQEMDDVELMLETFFIPKLPRGSRNLDVATVWQEAVKHDVTSTRFPVRVIDENNKKDTADGEEQLLIFLDKFPDGVEKTCMVQMKCVLDRIQHENFVVVCLLFLLLLFICAFAFGYASHAVACSVAQPKTRNEQQEREHRRQELQQQRQLKQQQEVHLHNQKQQKQEVSLPTDQKQQQQIRERQPRELRKRRRNQEDLRTKRKLRYRKSRYVNTDA